jgi:outer membrane protein assembly factor BamB
MPSSFATRMWGASDASPLIDGKNKYFVWPTESGIIYRGNLSVQKVPVPEQYHYTFPDHPKQGIESSPAAYKNLGYFTDNNGNVFCIDLRNMSPKWHFFNTDDTDGSPVLEVDQGNPFIYVGNEVDLQGPTGKAYLRKLNGLNGKLEWEYERLCYNVTKPKTDNGGMLSTPVVGKGKVKGLIWTIFSRVDQYGRGSFVCLNTADGKVKYEIPMKSYSWVSPIALYDIEGNAYIYFSDVSGNIYLIDGYSGEIMFKKNLDYIFESSPIAIGNRIIQPARGNRILSFVVK